MSNKLAKKKPFYVHVDSGLVLYRTGIGKRCEEHRRHRMCNGKCSGFNGKGFVVGMPLSNLKLHPSYDLFSYREDWCLHNRHNFHNYTFQPTKAQMRYWFRKSAYLNKGEWETE